MRLWLNEAGWQWEASSRTCLMPMCWLPHWVPVTRRKRVQTSMRAEKKRLRPRWDGFGAAGLFWNMSGGVGFLLKRPRVAWNWISQQ